MPYRELKHTSFEMLERALREYTLFGEKYILHQPIDIEEIVIWKKFGKAVRYARLAYETACDLDSGIIHDKYDDLSRDMLHDMTRSSKRAEARPAASA